MQAAGLLEHSLGLAQRLGERHHHRVAHHWPRRKRRAGHSDLLDGGLAADPAARGGEEVPAEGIAVERPGQPDGHHVVGLLLGGELAIRNRCDLVSALQQSLGIEEASGKLEVVSGRPHGDGHAGWLLARAARPDLHGLFPGQAVGPFEPASLANRHHPGGGHVSANGNGRLHPTIIA